MDGFYALVSGIVAAFAAYFFGKSKGAGDEKAKRDKKVLDMVARARAVSGKAGADGGFAGRVRDKYFRR
ncbi:MAG: hypothetical protein LBT92_00065 [Rickettsiales bacterium]|jgi:hypothetical protein|nr:hypothetical protein [Rickettsiales bacterium]